MLRQRIRTHSSRVIVVGRVLLVLFALALIWYGLMLLLLALKISPETVDTLSGYRTAYDYLAGLTPEDITGVTRLIAAIAGLLAFLLFGYLALQELPRPYLARSDWRFSEGQRGFTEIEPRAIERVAEAAALEQREVSSVSGRYGTDDIVLNVEVRRARDVAETLRAVRHGVRESLERHGLPSVPVNVTLTGFDRKQRRELS